MKVLLIGLLFSSFPIYAQIEYSTTEPYDVLPPVTDSEEIIIQEIIGPDGATAGQLQSYPDQDLTEIILTPDD